MQKFLEREREREKKKATWKTKKKMGEYIKMDIRLINCKDGTLMHVNQNCVRWRALVLQALNYDILSMFVTLDMKQYTANDTKQKNHCHIHIQKTGIIQVVRTTN